MENRPMFHDLYAVMYEYPNWFSLSDEKKKRCRKIVRTVSYKLRGGCFCIYTL